MAKRVLLFLVLVGVVVGAWFWRSRHDASVEDALPGMVAALEAETRVFQSLTWERPPMFGEPVEGFAWDHYREAARLYDEVDESLWGETEFVEATTDYLMWQGSPLTIPEGMISELLRFAPAIDGLIAGARCAAAGPAFRSFSEDRLDLIMSLTDLVRCGRAYAVWQLDQGQESRAVDVLLALIRVGADCARGTIWSDLVQGTRLRRDVMEFLCAAIANGALSEEAIRRVEESLVLSPVEPMLSRRILKASWLDEQWGYLRAVRGEEGVLEGLEDTLGPAGKLLPTGRLNVIAGWAWLREFEESVAAGMRVKTSADLRRIDGALKTSAAAGGFREEFYAGLHLTPYLLIANTHDCLVALQAVLAANIALHRSRVAGEADPKDLSGVIRTNLLVSPLVKPAIWCSHPEVEKPWIGIGTRPRRPPPAWVQDMIDEELEKSVEKD